MIEEFQDWLIRNKGVPESTASDMHDAAYQGDEAGLRKLAASYSDDEHDYTDEFVELYHEWQKEVGER